MADLFLKVQRVSLALWGAAFVGLLATLLHSRWIYLTGLVFVAGLSGMYVQASGRQRVLAVLVNLLLFVIMCASVVTLYMERRTDGARC